MIKRRGEPNTLQLFSYGLFKPYLYADSLRLPFFYLLLLLCLQPPEIPSEILIDKYKLQDLCAETAKLKSQGAMESIPSEKVVKLLNILELNIRDGSKVCPLPTSAEEEEEDADDMWLEMAIERVTRAADASLTVLHILTSKNMHKCVYNEDVIDR